MKKFAFVLLLALVAASCGKMKNSKHHDLVYYSEDYKEMDVTILGVEGSEIDAVWAEFYSKNDDKKASYDSYTLIVKHDGEFVKESGMCTFDVNDKITFTPSTGDTYYGTWVEGKEKYNISIDMTDRIEEITFVYKPVKKCGWGK